jgi:ribosomal protein S18 acetylase RimI-like enzyme
MNERPSWKLRPSMAADHDAIAEVWHDGASLPGVGPAVMPTLSELRHRVDLELAAGWRVTVAANQDFVIGFVATRPAEAVLDELFVRPGSIGRGIGRALLMHAMAEMPDGFTLYTRSANAAARRFYERTGLVFIRDGVHPGNGDPIAYYGWKAQ